MTVDEENGEKMKDEWIKENNTLDDYPFQLYSKARSTPTVNFDSDISPRKHQTQQRGGEKEKDKYYGLTLQRLKEIARTTGALGDEETIGQEAALNRLRDFMSMFMGSFCP
eukprot:CAMPEP_0119040794 /NCGR_PEP_ID=MMETSP1177-20130426/10827_1 /TAXON_ID=2985 /ORGANISM="Ochromonas sp, Strain CCMP1899" /LENGTH=110 /DNA_ID=CAMNT_0007006189 /DNA_START=98 /DNA_END=426 /DNA_ORIENTATION=+